ncbi:major facilitator superfamily domain-containing protein [Xylariaceae sp. FL0016]|nr:major facilitator superfamily domain-containing protein [Xylariaceae sp. FL0016]
MADESCKPSKAIADSNRTDIAPNLPEGNCAEDTYHDVEKGSIASAARSLSQTRSSSLTDEDGSSAVEADEVVANTAPISQPRSVASSIRRPANHIPMSERRGLFAVLSLVPEVDRPFDYSHAVKWTLTAFVALAAAAAPMGSAILYPALPELIEEFDSAPKVVNLSVALYMLSMSIFPLWWSSFSETFGRRSVYVVSFFLNIVFNLCSAFSVNVGMFIAFRVLAGGASASVQAVGAGTISDMWEVKDRGKAMGWFYIGPLAGPLVAPIVGGALTQPFGWRSSLYFLTAYGAVIFVLLLFGVPETLPRARQMEAAVSVAAPDYSASSQDVEHGQPLSQTTTRRSQVQVAHAWFKRLIVEPLAVLRFMKYKAISFVVFYAAVTFGTLYVLNISIQTAFAASPYNYDPLVVGLLYIPPSMGYFIAAMLGGPWLDRIMKREAKKAGRYDERGRLAFLPEDRVRENAWISACMYPAALLVFGWTVQRGVHVAVPCIANFFFGVGSMLVFNMATTMLTELLPKGKSSSGIALNNFFRNLLSFAGGEATQPLIESITVGWLCTGVAVIAWFLGNYIIYSLRKNSTEWRDKLNEALKDE